jgi:ATP-dependent phosphofructokinase / diphosphate-dependent phosphofructokinase
LENTESTCLPATRLGTHCAELLSQGVTGVMIAARGDSFAPVPLEDVSGKKNLIPPDHALLQSARLDGTSFGV